MRCSLSKIPNEKLTSNYTKAWTVVLMYGRPNLFSLGLDIPVLVKRKSHDLIGAETNLYRDPLLIETKK